MFRAKNQIAFHIFHTAALCSYALASREFLIVRTLAIMWPTFGKCNHQIQDIKNIALFQTHQEVFHNHGFAKLIESIQQNTSSGWQWLQRCSDFFWVTPSGEIVFSIIIFEEEKNWTIVSKLQSNISHGCTGLIATNLGWRIIHDFIPGRGLLDESSEFHIVVAWDCRGPLTGVAFFAYTALSADWEGMQNLWPVGKVESQFQ